MDQANTKEMRDDLLKRFFKTALAAVRIKYWKHLSNNQKVLFMFVAMHNVCYYAHFKILLYLLELDQSLFFQLQTLARIWTWFFLKRFALQ